MLEIQLVTDTHACTGLQEVHISDLAAWCGIKFESLTDNPLYYAKHLFMDGKEITDLVIPEGVTSIVDAAFHRCVGLTSVTIPSSVTFIGESAFNGCSGLKEVHISDLAAWCGIEFVRNDSNPLVYAKHLFMDGKEITDLVIPEGVTSIGNYAFYYCTGLTSVTLPSTITSFGKDVFTGTPWWNSFPNGLLYVNQILMGYKGVKPTGEIVIEEGTIAIAGGAFSSCAGLTSVIIPSSVITIGDWAFYDTGLTSLTIPSSVTSIGNSAFSHTRLTSITIPESVITIGDAAFESCTRLTSVTIPSSMTTIGDIAFRGCTSLTSVTIPESVTNIGDQAFSGCTGLTIVTIPSSVTSIGDDAFSGCTGLTIVTIPEGVTSIGNSAFSRCTGLASVTIPSSATSIGDQAFSGCTGLTIVNIPEGVTSIGNSAFSRCTGLASVTIPSSATSIGDYAFYNCTGLTSVTSLIREPFAINWNVFQYNNNFTTATLYVPTGTREKYAATEGWRGFTAIEEIEVSDQPKGDVNGDQTVDVADIASVISVMAKGDNDATADVNGDGTVDVADIATIISIMAAKARQQEVED